MAHYLMTVHGPAEIDEFGGYDSEAEMTEAIDTTETFNDQLRAKGYWVFAGGLAPASKAKVVDGHGDAAVMTDGPYLESKELLAGFWVLDVPSHQLALELAAEASRCCGGKVEVRPFDPISGGPAS